MTARNFGLPMKGNGGEELIFARPPLLSYASGGSQQRRGPQTLASSSPKWMVRGLVRGLRATGKALLVLQSRLRLVERPLCPQYRWRAPFALRQTRRCNRQEGSRREWSKRLFAARKGEMTTGLPWSSFFLGNKSNKPASAATKNCTGRCGERNSSIIPLLSST
jgi:hypothetical protein